MIGPDITFGEIRPRAIPYRFWYVALIARTVRCIPISRACPKDALLQLPVEQALR